MEGRPSLAVVVPTLNEEELLPRLLERLGVAPQDGRREADRSGADRPDEVDPPDEVDRPDEVVVVDGGSRDGTLDLVRASGARLLECAPGRGTQLAAGARGAASELLLFLHADSLPAPGALAAVRALFRARPEVVASGLRQRIEAPGLFYRLVERAADRRVRRGQVWGDSGLCVRRDTYHDVGGFPDVPLFEDVELARRLRRAGATALVEDARLFVSARRWRAEGRLRATLRNRLLAAGFALGVEPSRLIRYYSPQGPSDGHRGTST